MATPKSLHRHTPNGSHKDLSQKPGARWGFWPKNPMGSSSEATELECSSNPALPVGPKLPVLPYTPLPSEGIHPQNFSLSSTKSIPKTFLTPAPLGPKFPDLPYTPHSSQNFHPTDFSLRRTVSTPKNFFLTSASFLPAGNKFPNLVYTPLPSQGFHPEDSSLRTPKSGFSYPKKLLGNGIPEIFPRELLPTAPHPKESLGLSLL